jgi:uncharacterized repeat protein (TIGR03847 family)
MGKELELRSVDFITIGTIGPAGKRVFHIQAAKGETLVTFIIEKIQASALVEGLNELLDTIKNEFHIETLPVEFDSYSLSLREPIVPGFRVGQIGIGYDETSDEIVLVLGELLPEDAPDEPDIVRLTASRRLVQQLAAHTQTVISQGRPICPHCGEPIDPDGHFCPKRNGHRKPVPWA